MGRGPTHASPNNSYSIIMMVDKERTTTSVQVEHQDLTIHATSCQKGATRRRGETRHMTLHTRTGRKRRKLSPSAKVPSTDKTVRETHCQQVLARTRGKACCDIISLELGEVGGLTEVPDSCHAIEAGRSHLVVVVAVTEKAASRYLSTSTRKTPQHTQTLDIPEKALTVVSCAGENRLTRVTIHGRDTNMMLEDCFRLSCVRAPQLHTTIGSDTQDAGFNWRERGSYESNFWSTARARRVSSVETPQILTRMHIVELHCTIPGGGSNNPSGTNSQAAQRSGVLE